MTNQDNRTQNQGMGSKSGTNKQPEQQQQEGRDKSQKAPQAGNKPQQPDQNAGARH